MATVVKPRTAIIIALTVTAAAVSSLVLLPRWRAAKETSRLLSRPAVSSEQSKSLGGSNVEDGNIQQAADDREDLSMWKPPPRGKVWPAKLPLGRRLPEARKKSSVLLTPRSPSNSKPRFLEPREALPGDQGHLQKLTSRINFESQSQDSDKENDDQKKNTTKLLKSLLRGKPNQWVPNVFGKAAIADYKATVSTTTLTTTTSPVRLRFADVASSLSASAPTNIKQLPSMKRGSVEIRPERLPPPAHSSGIYISLLTAPKFHDTRVSLLYLTWLQTIDPKQVIKFRMITFWVQ